MASFLPTLTFTNLILDVTATIIALIIRQHSPNADQMMLSQEVCFSPINKAVDQVQEIL